ncbi:type VI secretion system baseplate subunit TssE [Thiomonas sp.]|jgi:type VI secretion system protein|uniref:type VI secretion system baseplate subunit TssE n=1 Tax=Thiomonas sp. TaxID=2047785 RepID=UPI0026191462|nr:type VI secretion system baseplate subunit TssE [Thiomonas sp.]
MHRARLLERIAAREALAGSPRAAALPAPSRANPGRASASGIDASAPQLLRSVIAHLTRVLNTRHGSVPIDPDFGMRDFGDLDGGSAAGEVADLEAQLQSMIERYEPRLLHPRVRMRGEKSDALCMSFDLEASILQAGREQPWCLTTRIDARGRVRIDDASD